MVESSHRIVILGSSGHASVIADLVAREGRWRVAGVIDPARPVGSLWQGLEVLGRDEDVPALAARLGLHGGIVAVGDNVLREKITGRIRRDAPGFALVTAVHPAAVVAPSAQLGPGTVVMAGAVINPGARVGEGCIVNTRASLDHDSVLGDYASLAPASATGGFVTIGHGSAIGLGALVREGTTIGEHTVVGAGALVLRDLPDRVVAFGQPARVVRARLPGEKYLR